jgi:hypothetical protein
MPIEGHEGNIRGKESERRVADLLSSYPHVTAVNFTEENTEMIDLEVIFSTDQEEIPFSAVNVQVKSSSHSVDEFRRIKLKAKIQATEDEAPNDIQRRRNEWLAENRLVILNGGDIKCKKTKNKRSITDEEIIADFTSHLTSIVNFSKSADQREDISFAEKNTVTPQPIPPYYQTQERDTSSSR